MIYISAAGESEQIFGSVLQHMDFLLNSLVYVMFY